MHKLKPCPDKPNCVSSLATDARHKVEPLRFKGKPQLALNFIKESLTKNKAVKIVSEKDGYLHLTFTTPILKFTDDVEFAIDKTNRLIHLKSASRIGYNDLGTNRRRVEKIRASVQARLLEGM